MLQKAKYKDVNKERRDASYGGQNDCQMPAQDDDSNAFACEIADPERDLNSRSLSRQSCPKITSHGNLAQLHTHTHNCEPRDVCTSARARLSVALCDKRMKHYGAVNHTRRTHHRNYHRIMPQIVLNEFDGV